jgi:hypothetical protein
MRLPTPKEWTPKTQKVDVDEGGSNLNDPVADTASIPGEVQAMEEDFLQLGADEGGNLQLASEEYQQQEMKYVVLPSLDTQMPYHQDLLQDLPCEPWSTSKLSDLVARHTTQIPLDTSSILVRPEQSFRVTTHTPIQRKQRKKVRGSGNATATAAKAKRKKKGVKAGACSRQGPPI